MPSTCTSSISSSSRNCGARPQLPPCPGPGPAPRRHSRLMRRSHPGQVMVPVLPPAPDSSGEPRGPRLSSPEGFGRPQTPRRSLARPLALTERAPQGSLASPATGDRTRWSTRTHRALFRDPPPTDALVGQDLGVTDELAPESTERVGEEMPKASGNKS